MRRIRVYVDTSVFGGVADEEFAGPSRRFFDRVQRGDFLVLLSLHTADELADAPEQVKQIVETLPAECVQRVTPDDEVTALAEAYIAAGVLGRASELDARHVAAATLAPADLLLSWNFKHIVNYDRIRKFNGVNVLNGYATIDIRSPLEMEHAGEDQDV